ncbi:MAG: signal recognition particle-docking protein FtsY [Trichodesmium sp. St16_bin4-tuft]|nr:signal recognition particle-docking protein FtsY [Trichodesmium sp. St4_bin8_1]MDE5072227.1 signal recognition particle-docking protein FtsY [Trichodesmium sp. St5_bin8]MDE5078000.1 signal recognition particle-docking protein FtsY [Trichodesmium sp. St2_bin6]MDE5090342.1 signal recognition particle-docking protein FtsY [Trichodesmium sp. St18_bin3_1_1]MDE5100275.1 signal recognition particle-docking protein FtsY [Trichodesmium sp. St16_bin4-tuft]MDE5105321.1 signal recognition particle-dock
MVFNWFRRKYNDSSDKTSKEKPAPKKEKVEAAVESQEKSGQESTDSKEDYLSWAKAAYKNIQEQKKAQDSVQDATGTFEKEEKLETQTTATTVKVEPSIPEPPKIKEQEDIAGQKTESTSTSTQAELIPSVRETAPREIKSSELKIPVESDSVLETTAVVDKVDEDLPFWAKAQAERQARVERLKETAIEEPEPEILQEITVDNETEEIDPIIIDEAFLWSAEVLAAQGRRPDQVSAEEITWLKKLRQGLDRTRRNLLNQLKAIVGQGPLNQDAVMEIESMLLQADVGVEATDYIIETLQNKLRSEALPLKEAIAYLKKILRDILDEPFKDLEVASAAYNLTFVPEKDSLNIWLLNGVNGAGKTTTIGKIAHLATKSDYKCLIAAADTFRAAAVEQLTIWGQRSEVEVIANPGKNTDPAAIVFDAILAAQSRNTELLLVDTAGRLQNKKNLMDELSKIHRIVDRKAPDAVVESLLVLDATLGQNGLRQAEVFAKAAKLSGVVLTKLDGTAKGGVALAVVKQLGLPIRFIGVGEKIEDLRPFSSYEFVEALISG